MSEKLTLQICRTIKSERTSVFDAWTRPELMQRWFAPGAMTVTSATGDLRVGGTYQVEMSGDNGSGKCMHAAVGGTYKEIVPHELVRFSWAWPADPTPESLVTVEFKGEDARTEITLTHDGLASQEAFDKHQHGWLGCLEKLVAFCESSEFAGTEANGDWPWYGTGPEGNFERRVAFHTPRKRIFDGIATADGIRGWWTTIVSGSGKTGGELRLEFAGLDEYIIMRVDDATSPSSIQWTCVVHTDLPEWAGTKMTFDLVEVSRESSELNFRHIGLTPKLTCYHHCEIGWDRFLASLVRYVETGEGVPFGAQMKLARPDTHAI